MATTKKPSTTNVLRAGLAAIALAVLAYGLSADGSAQQSATALVVVDTKRLLQAHIQAQEARISQGATLTPQQLELSGQTFAADFLRAVRRYSDRGSLVVDRQFAVAVPAGVDRTEEVAKVLGLALGQAAPDPFVAPE